MAVPRPPGDSPPADVDRPVRAGTPAQGRVLRKRGREMVARLLESGVTAFDQMGYHAARVDDIVKVAGTSHGTFYLYFANKEDLFRSLTLEVADRLNELADSLTDLAPGARGYDRLRAWISDFADLYAHYGSVIRAWTEAEVAASEFGDLSTEVLATFAHNVAKHIADSDIPGLDPEAAALAIVAMIERFNYYVLSGQVRTSRDEMLDTLTAAVHAGLFTRTRSRRP